MSARTSFKVLFLAVALTFASVGLVHAQGDGAAAGEAGGGRGGRGGGRGNFDPAEFQKRMMDGVKEQLGASDDEWTVISPRVTAVMDVQRKGRSLTAMGGMGGGRGGMGGRGGRGGDQAATGAGATTGAAATTGGQNERPAEYTALEKAIEGGDAATIKTAMEALRAARKAHDTELATARASLREVLTPKQEAQLVLSGLLD